MPSPSRAVAIRNLGEFEDAVILKAFGEVPEDFAAPEYELLGIGR